MSIEKFPLYFWFEVLAMIISVISFARLKGSVLIYFVPFLFLIVLYEFGTFQAWFVINRSNHWAANIMSTIEILFYCYIFYTALSGEKNKRIVLFTSIALVVYTIFNMIFIQGLFRFHTISYRVGSIVIIIFVYLYFKQLLNNEAYLRLRTIPFFWISVGLLFFFAGFFVYFCAFDFVAYTTIKKYASLFLVTSSALNILLYSFISIGLLCQKKIPM
jgi:hypothetical protein